ncbi:hypothetical protein [Varibaculum cambriense]|uniref:Uncharacterized protein n=1 Tax=Varibaculum cambriense TaxID=184870 RepID=A0AAJ1BE02_9ACTO|nr:hypothetical protein [Varibaculum cambriense]
MSAFIVSQAAVYDCPFLRWFASHSGIKESMILPGIFGFFPGQGIFFELKREGLQPGGVEWTERIRQKKRRPKYFCSR